MPQQLRSLLGANAARGSLQEGATLSEQGLLLRSPHPAAPPTVPPQYRTTKNYKSPDYLGPRVADKLIFS